MTRAEFAICMLLAAPGAARAAGYASPAYDAKIAPLDDLSRELLTGNGYEIREDGGVWDKINESSVKRDDMPFLLSRLASARRLRALLQINAIITKYDSEKKVSPEDKEAVRGLVRQNWVVFGITPRRDLRSYFSLQELESLDKIPSRFETMSPVTMTDPVIDSPTAAAPTPVMVAPAAVAVVKIPAPVVAPAALPAAVKPSVPLATPELGFGKPWTPPVEVVDPPRPSTATVAIASTTVAVPPAAHEPPPPAVLSAAEYEKFVADGPYSKEGRALLELIGKRAPDFCLPLLRRTVVGLIPQIVFDGSRTGTALRAGFVVDAANAAASPVIALSHGPVMVGARKSFFGERADTLLPESPQAWSELGLPRPALDAFGAEKTPSRVESGSWGAVRIYADGSRRGTYSNFEQAGELLEQLLLIGLDHEGFGASPYAARRWARTARLILSSRFQEEFSQDSFLDPDRRAELRGWQDRPAEEDDLAVASWAGSRAQTYDPRRGPPLAERARNERLGADCAREVLISSLSEASRRRARRVGLLESLAEADVIEAGGAKESAKAAQAEEAATWTRLTSSAPTCPAPLSERAEGLRRSSLIAVEAARVERTWRESKKEGGDHAR